jgi:UDP-glucose 4-epimerase
MSKALMEKVMAAASRNLDESKTRICATRYGNVMASRGSVIPLFMEQIRMKSPITITNPEMTRFMMSLDEAVELVLYAFEHGHNGDIFVRKAPASTIAVLASAIAELMNAPNHPILVIGSRHGEKLYESLLTREEKAMAIEEELYFRIPPDTRDLNYAKYFEKGETRLTEALVEEEYTSHNTVRLGHYELLQVLRTLKLL